MRLPAAPLGEGRPGASSAALVFLPICGPARFGILLIFYRKMFSSGKSQNHWLELICVSAHLLRVGPLYRLSLLED